MSGMEPSRGTMTGTKAGSVPVIFVSTTGEALNPNRPQER
jgi:hypothetical protein